MEKQGYYYCKYLGESIYEEHVIAFLGNYEVTPFKLDSPTPTDELRDFLEFLDWLNNELEPKRG